MARGKRTLRRRHSLEVLPSPGHTELVLRHHSAYKGVLAARYVAAKRTRSTWLADAIPLFFEDIYFQLVLKPKFGLKKSVYFCRFSLQWTLREL